MPKTVELEQETVKLIMGKIRAARLNINDGNLDRGTKYLKEVELFLLLRLSEKRKDAAS